LETAEERFQEPEKFSLEEWVRVLPISRPQERVLQMKRKQQREWVSQKSPSHHHYHHYQILARFLEPEPLQGLQRVHCSRGRVQH